MRGPLWRGWLWAPRIWWRWLARATANRAGGEQQHRQRVRADAMPTRAHGWHWGWWFGALAVGVGAVFVVLFYTQVVAPVYHLVASGLTGRTPEPHWPTAWNPCRGANRAHCATLIEFFKPLITAAVALTVFFLLTHWRVRWWYQRLARERAPELVATDDPTVDVVVGRQELCEVLIERIRHPDVRCPMVLVGGLGTGKTAVLVELTRQLARRRIVPVPVRMRDAQGTTNLDFEALAKARFLELIDSRLFSDAHGVRLWRQLRLTNRVAVLADGLQDAFGRTQEQDEESMLRAAISHAADNRLPLVLTSRPYDPLRGMRAIVVGLEPIGETAALEYGLDGEAGNVDSSWGRIVDLVNAADVTDSPIYLAIIRDLRRQGRLPRQGLGRRTDPHAAARPVDRYAARWHLLNAWRDALLDGALYEDVTRSRDDRAATLDVLAAYACIGLARNSSRIEYRHLSEHASPENARIFQLLRHRTGPHRLDPNNPDHLTHATIEGDELSIVDARREDVRFLHGVVQAYLGRCSSPTPACADSCYR